MQSHCKWSHQVGHRRKCSSQTYCEKVISLSALIQRSAQMKHSSCHDKTSAYLVFICISFTTCASLCYSKDYHMVAVVTFLPVGDVQKGQRERLKRWRKERIWIVIECFYIISANTIITDLFLLISIILWNINSKMMSFVNISFFPWQTSETYLKHA